jgi:hypothetical protein
MTSKTGRDKYFCHSCGGVTVSLTPQEADQERKEGHQIELWSEIEKKYDKAPKPSP